MKTGRFHRLLCLLVTLAMSVTLFSSIVFATEVAHPEYFMDAEALTDGTIAVLFIKDGTASSGVVTGGTLYLGIYDPASGNWTETPVGAEAPNAKEAALAVSGTTAHVAYVTSDDKIAYTYQTGAGWAEEEVIESNNCNDKIGALSSVDIALDSNGKAHIAYLDSQGANDDYYKYNDGMYANNVSGSFVKYLAVNGTGYFSSPDGNWTKPLGAIKVVASGDAFGAACIVHTHSQWQGGHDDGYACDFIFPTNTSSNTDFCDEYKNGTLYETCYDGTNTFSLLYIRGNYKVLNGTTVIEGALKETSNMTADLTLSGSNIYYAAINGTSLLFYQNGTFVEDKTATTGINSSNNKCGTVVVGDDQFIIYTGSDANTSLVIEKLDGEGEISEFVVPNTSTVYNVTITAGSHMTKSTGEASQSVDAGEDMETVIYTADEGYCFPTTYSVESVNGVTVTRDSFTQITVSGTPEDDTVLVLTAVPAHVPGEATRENEEAPTCTEDGSYDAVICCTVCGTEISRTPTVDPALGHNINPEAVPEVPATCSETGVEAYYTCTRCDQLFADSEGNTPIDNPVTIEKIPHTPGEAEIDNEEAPTCTEDGSYDLVVCCEVCGYEISRTPTVDPATGHTLSPVAEEPATCTEPGTEGYWECTVCNAMFSDEEGNTPIEAPTQIEATGHTLSPVAEEPATCTEPGYEAYWECTVCNAMFSDEEGNTEIEEPVQIAALGHTWGEWNVTKEATTKEKGSKERTCSVCSEKEVAEIPKKTSHGGGGSSSGGSSSSTSVTPTPIPTEISTEAPTGTSTEEEHIWSEADDWAVEELEKAEEKEIIPTTLKKKSFKNKIDRTDFAAVAVKLYEAVSGKTAEPAAENPFIDTDNEYVLKAYALGITNGTSENTFTPEVPISREQMATMLTRALLAAGVDTTVDLDNAPKFEDDGDMHEWGRSAVYFMAKDDIIKGIGDNTFNALGDAKIEEAILIALRSVEVYGIKE